MVDEKESFSSTIHGPYRGSTSLCGQAGRGQKEFVSAKCQLVTAMSAMTIDYSLRMLPRGNACVECRQRKRKCDGVQPSCNTCKRLDRICKYHPGQPSPMRMLKEKVWELEQRLRATTEKITPVSPSTTLKSGSSEGSGSPDIPLAPNYAMEWWLLDEIPPLVADCLMTVFLKHASQFNFDEQVSSLVDRLYRYSPSHPMYPQPSLLSAIYLCASFYMSSQSHPIHNRGRLDWDFEAAEKLLLRKTRKALRTCLTNLDNILYFLLGSTLLVEFYYLTMRNSEGHHEATGAMRLAEACNLLSIQDGSTYPYPSILGQPAKPQDVLDRVNAIWSLFIIDRAGSFVEGLPLSVPDERITTAFPCPIWNSTDPMQFEDSPPKLLSLSSIYSEIPGVADLSRDSILSIKAKCATVMTRVRDFITEAVQRGITDIKTAPADFADRFPIGDRTLTKLLKTLPRTHVHESALPYDRVLADLAACTTSLCCCIIHYHGHFASSNYESHSKMLSAASVIVAVAQGLGKISEIYWPLCIMMGWGDACEVFHAEIRSILDNPAPGASDIGTVDKLLNDMEFLAKMGLRYNKVFRHHTRCLGIIQLFLDSALEIVKESRLGLRPRGSKHVDRPRQQLDTRPMKFVNWLGRLVKEGPPSSKPLAG